jgi:hypothetical protein
MSLRKVKHTKDIHILIDLVVYLIIIAKELHKQLLNNQFEPNKLRKVRSAASPFKFDALPIFNPICSKLKANCSVIFIKSIELMNLYQIDDKHDF